MHFFKLMVNEQVVWNCESGIRNCPVKIILISLFSSDGSLPWHRVHAVSPEGPVAKNGVVQPGDHLVEVNSHD